MDHSHILENRAFPPNSLPEEQEICCSNCDETWVFAMQDKEHTFSLGLTTVIQCLAVAEKQGAVPKLPDDWWLQLCNRSPQFAEAWHSLSHKPME